MVAYLNPKSPIFNDKNEIAVFDKSPMRCDSIFLDLTGDFSYCIVFEGTCGAFPYYAIQQFGETPKGIKLDGFVLLKAISTGEFSPVAIPMP